MGLAKAFVEYFRCPREFASFGLEGPVSGTPGFFKVGSEVVCFGLATPGICEARPDGPLRDALTSCRSNEGQLVLSFDPSQTADLMRREAYVGGLWNASKTRTLKGMARGAYYIVRPLLPVEARRPLQRLALRGWQRIPFPQWPVDTSVDAMMRALLLLQLNEIPGDSIPFVWFWPDGHESAAIITHDVETERGRDFCREVVAIDESFGFRSSFQIVPEKRYEVTESFLEELRERGLEINVHGLNHDGGLFRSEQAYLQRVERINAYSRAWDAKGFRSPVLYRNASWMRALDFEYDMSFPNVAHLDPQRGGCCTVMPYFIDELVELPVTLTQDYSLFHILDQYSLDLWLTQIKLVGNTNGLISVIVHPDYIDEGRAKSVYVALLENLVDMKDSGELWTAIPGDVARWWWDRSRTRVVHDNGAWGLQGPAEDRGRVALATVVNEKLRFEICD